MDEAAARGYLPSTDSLAGPDRSLPSDYQLPSRHRYGTVLPVTAEGLARVRAAYPNS